MYKDDCIFCKIAKGDIPSYKIWEDGKYLAFLDIEPAVEGMTLVIPKEHHNSYFAKLDSNVVCDLMKASQKVALLLDNKLENVLRTKMVFEGLDVDHLHAKLYPMYEGKPTPESGGRKISREDLEKTAKKISD